MPSISVLFPVYNCEVSYLKKAIESILNQTFKDFELIIYDDGSDYDVESIIKDYSKTDLRIIFIKSNKNHGLAFALNQMIKIAKGKYLARMDADDISSLDRFEKEYEFLETHPEYGFVGGNLLLMDSDDKVYGKRNYPERPKRKDFLKFQPYAHPTIMFRKSVLTMKNPYGNATTPGRGEDYQLFMNLTAAGVKGYNLQEDLLQYRETKDSYRRRKLSDQIEEVGIRWNGFKKMGLNPWHELFYVLKPIIVWLVPNRLAFAIRNGYKS
ncbi:glycosyltransferase [Pseudobutyrivibrio ruminis]|uniref:glycosyltransferase n=1 Tax=Pseudobutyrivibrio ruminis TaxID=46206 RepID=UPI00041FACE1|nr:glycosyltransferase [Pseudobutyrivibrio ruminis]